MTKSITKMKLMLLALYFAFRTSQEESISPYKGMLQMNHCREYKVTKTLRLLTCYSACVNVPVDYKILRAEYFDRNSCSIFCAQMSNSEFCLTHRVGIISCGEKHDVFQICYLLRSTKDSNQFAYAGLERSVVAPKLIFLR